MSLAHGIVVKETPNAVSHSYLYCVYPAVHRLIPGREFLNWQVVCVKMLYVYLIVFTMALCRCYLQ